MARDIEEFLRRAAERRKQSQSGGTAPPPRKSAPPRAPQAPPKQRLAQEQVLRPDEIDPYARKKSQAEAEPKPQAAPKRPPKPPQQQKGSRGARRSASRSNVRSMSATSPSTPTSWERRLGRQTSVWRRGWRSSTTQWGRSTERLRSPTTRRRKSKGPTVHNWPSTCYSFSANQNPFDNRF